MTPCIIVGSIFLSSDELFWVEELTVSSSSYLINNSGLKIDENGTRDMLSGTSLGEKGIERVVTSTYKKIVIIYRALSSTLFVLILLLIWYLKEISYVSYQLSYHLAFVHQVGFHVQDNTIPNKHYQFGNLLGQRGLRYIHAKNIKKNYAVWQK